MTSYIKPNHPGLFDTTDRLAELAEMGDPLARLDSVIDWNLFSPVLAQIPKAEPKGPGGRPSFRPLLMFKALIIANLYQLSDGQLQFQITDRASFKQFLGLTDADPAPDEKTFWAFRESLVQNQLIEVFFAVFHAELDRLGMFARKGQLIDATFIEVPRQRNTREENATIKSGEVPPQWEQQPAKARQKDLDARWATKNGERHYGYKNHVSADSKSKLIDRYTVTSASVHDSQALDILVKVGDPTTYVDSAYTGEPCEKIFVQRQVSAKPIERAYRNRPLNERQKKNNRTRSRVRVRVEHIFGTMRMCMRKAFNRCIGGVRNRATVGLTNLMYNMIRYEQIERLGLKNWRTC